MKRLILGLVVALLSGLAFAQQTTQISSIRNQVDSDVMYGITVTPLDGSSGAPAPLSAIAQNWPAATSFAASTQFTFPANAAAYNLVGFRVTITPSGTGFAQTAGSGPLSLDVPVTPPMPMPAGVTLLVTVNAPLSGLGSLVSAVGPDTVPPSAPGTLTASATSTTSAALSWSAASDNVAVTSSIVERCQGAACSAFATVGAVQGVLSAYFDSTVSPGLAYSWRVRSSDAAGNLGAYSNVASATQPAPPPPVVPPPVVPPPVVTPPPPTQTANKLCDCISSAPNPKCTFTQLVTSDGGVWKLSGTNAQNITLNGVMMTQKQQPFSAHILYINSPNASFVGGVPWLLGDSGYQFYNNIPPKTTTTPPAPFTPFWTYNGHPPNAGCF